MKRLKMEYILNSILIIWSEVLVAAIGLIPVALAVTLAIFFGPVYLFFLFALLISIPFCLCVFLMVLDEHFDLISKYEVEKIVYGNRRRER